MKNPQSSGSPLNVRKYLKKFDGLEITPTGVSSNAGEKNTNETIVLDKWVRRDFPEMGFTAYTDLDPPKNV